jgi:hypothetical protein
MPNRTSLQSNASVGAWKPNVFLSVLQLSSLKGVKPKQTHLPHLQFERDAACYSTFECILTVHVDCDIL